MSPASRRQDKDWDLGDYAQVDERIVEFRTKHPEGSLSQVRLDFLEFGGKSWVVYVAAAYRSPDDPQPGIGSAWEEVPGRTPYTRDSELQNAETSAWGRAIVAALAADVRRGIATAEDVRNRTAPPVQRVPDPPTPARGPMDWRQRFAITVRESAVKLGITDADTLRHAIVRSATEGRTDSSRELSDDDRPAVLAVFRDVQEGYRVLDGETLRAARSDDGTGGEGRASDS